MSSISAVRVGHSFSSVAALGRSSDGSATAPSLRLGDEALPAGAVALVDRVALRPLGMGSALAVCNTRLAVAPTKTELAVRNVNTVAAQLGLPTRMLAASLAQHSFGDATDDNVSRLTNQLHLSAATARAASAWAASAGSGFGAAVGSVYHEATHQFLEGATDPLIRRLVADGAARYAAADVESRYPGLVERSQSPKVLFHEAVANYVDHRVATWVAAKGALEAAKRNGTLTPAMIEKTARDYDTDMARRVFGYEDTSLWETALGGPERKYTSMAIPEAIRSVVDGVLLEGRFKERFWDDPELRAYTQQTTP